MSTLDASVGNQHQIWYKVDRLHRPDLDRQQQPNTMGINVVSTTSMKAGLATLTLVLSAEAAGGKYIGDRFTDVRSIPVLLQHMFLIIVFRPTSGLTLSSP